MPTERGQVNRESIRQIIQAIRAYHDQGRQSLRDFPERGKHGSRLIEEQAERLGWNPTKLRKARQFAHSVDGYSRGRLKELCRLLGEYRPEFGISHIGLLVTVPWPDREHFQRECVASNWSTSELQAAIKMRYGSRCQGGRKRQVPSNPEHVLIQIDEMADSWLRWVVRASECRTGERSIIDSLPDPIPARLKKIHGAMTRLREVVLIELETARAKKGNPG